MAEVRWVRVQIPEALHLRVREAKARADVTWDLVVLQGVELWLAAEAAKQESK